MQLAKKPPIFTNYINEINRQKEGFQRHYNFYLFGIN